jgi:NADH-quinone oxidoreductase subunit A
MLGRMESQIVQYLPVLILLLVAVGFAVSTLAVSVLFGKMGRRTRTKDVPYECGMLPEGEGNSRLSVKFYLVALLFVLFDIEVIFMYPWAVVYKEMLGDSAALVIGGMGVFLALMVVGFIYEVRRRAFDWRT